jgi:hypothetical protein
LAAAAADVAVAVGFPVVAVAADVAGAAVVDSLVEQAAAVVVARAREDKAVRPAAVTTATTPAAMSMAHRKRSAKRIARRWPPWTIRFGSIGSRMPRTVR